MGSKDVVLAKYVFLDIVAFSRRTVEDQAYLVAKLNAIVEQVLGRVREDEGLTDESLILLPTGDGICIALINVFTSPDIHVRIAMELLELIHDHNAAASQSRRFALRIGINSNHDNLVTDVNGRRNVAGAGINMAQRIMSMADGGQIMVGTMDYGALSQRSGYTDAFRTYTAVVKHGVEVMLYQYIGGDAEWLNRAEPSQFGDERADQLFTARATNADYLRRFSPEVLRDAERAIRTAYFPPDAPPDVESFIDTLHRHSETPSVWRADYELFLTLEPSVEEPGSFTTEADFSWKFVNHSDEPAVIPQCLYTTPALDVLGKSPEQLLRMHSVVVEDESQLSDFHASIVDDGFASQLALNVNVPPYATDRSAFRFRYRISFLQEQNQPWFLVMFSPLCKLTVSMQHPRNLDPTLYVFGLNSDGKESTPLKPRKELPTFREWVYDGWLLPQHGLWLLLHEKEAHSSVAAST